MVQIMACRLFGVKPSSEPNAGILLIGPLGANFNEILIEIHIFSFKKMSSGKWWPCCLSLKALTFALGHHDNREANLPSHLYGLLVRTYLRHVTSERCGFRAKINHTMPLNKFRDWNSMVQCYTVVSTMRACEHWGYQSHPESFN